MSEKLYRITYSLPQCRADIDGLRRGEIYPAKTLAKYTDQELGRELVGEGPPDLGKIETPEQLIDHTKGIRDWINGPVAQRLGWGRLRTVGVGGPSIRHEWRTDNGGIAAASLVLPLVYGLIDAAVTCGYWQEAAPPSQLGRGDALIVLNKIAACAAKVVAPSEAGNEDEQPSEAEQPTAPTASGMSRQEVGERLERLRAQGEPYTSQHKLAKALGCSSRTVNDAIRENPALSKWAKRPGAIPRAQSLNNIVTDAALQNREPDPADDAAIREYQERDLTPDERVFFNGLSRENQLMFLDDPDKHDRILGRTP